MRRYIGLVACPVLMLALTAQVQVAPAFADVFNGRDQPQDNPGCQPPVINGITPKNWSCRTGTQGAQGDPNCSPPVEIINGQPVTPRNWSCPGGTPSARTAPIGPFEIHHAGPAYIPGAANPCQPGGPGAYNWLANPVGTQLPPGCMRPARTPVIIRTYDPNYDALPMNNRRMPPNTPMPENYRRPPMPLGQIDGPQNFRRPILPRGQIATGTGSANSGAGHTVYFGKVDPNYEPLPMNNQRPQPVPPGDPAANDRQPDMPVGQIATGTSFTIQLNRGQASQSIRIPELPFGQIATGTGRTIPLNRNFTR